jgi:hypothetical protein
MRKICKVQNSGKKNLGKKRPSLFSRLWGYIATFLTGLATMFGILSYVNPNVTVTPLMELDTERVFSTQFTVCNNGYLAIHDMEYGCAIENVQGRFTIGTLGGPPGLNEHSPRLYDLEHNFKSSLDTNHCDTISFDFSLFKNADPIMGADIGIVVSFRVGIIPLHQERIYHFVTKKSSDGKLHWFPRPIDKK